MAQRPQQWTRPRESTVMVGALSAALVLGAVACRPPEEAKAKSPTAILRIGASLGEMATSNPQTGVRQVAQNLTLEGLIKAGEDGRPTAWLARSWEFTPDGRLLKIHLRPGVTFHDGAPVTASSIVTSLQRALPDIMGPAFAD